jgi:pimeloyl-ACP methyl ester carboxylesterase
VQSARHVYDQARSIAPRSSVAVIAWLGYRTPGWTQVAFDARAHAGAELLARDVAGLRAARFGAPPHLTLIGHSYGSTTASLALRDTSAWVDDAVFVGSPGLLAARAADLPVPAGHVWVGAASGDEISHLSRFGVDPAAHSFGAHRFPAESPPGTPLVAQHTRYLAAHTASLRNVARIVVGLGRQVPSAPGRVDSGLLGELERFAASEAQVPIIPPLLGPEPGDPTFEDPGR